MNGLKSFYPYELKGWKVIPGNWVRIKGVISIHTYRGKWISRRSKDKEGFR